MPLYDYKCPSCGSQQEALKPLCQCNDIEECNKCGTVMDKIITLGHGGTHGDEAPWINDTNDALTSPYDRRITNRTEYKQRLKEKGVTPIG